MRYILVLALALIAGNAIAKETTHHCHDPEINRQWVEARERHPKDALVRRLAAYREALCAELADGTIDLPEAESQWQTALTDALLERAREEQRERGLLWLFATF